MSRLEWIVRALSQPHDVQERLFPNFVEVADELALNWEEALSPYLNVCGGFGTFTAEQKAALLNVDNYLMLMSGKDNAHLWTMEALENSAEWNIVRDLAMQILVLMKWPMTLPPDSSDIYVGSPY